MNAVALQSFGFGEQLVRVVDRAGAAWFVANDVCAALELQNSRKAVSALEEDERDGVTISDAMGRLQETTIISESGLYALIFRSRKPVAVTFRKWVTQDVLPSIRRTGGYALPANDEEPEGQSPAQRDEADAWRTGLLLVREARIVGGRRAALRAWALAGLPDVFEDERSPPVLALTDAHRPLNEWMAERCEFGREHRERSRDLFEDYASWCLSRGRTPPAPGGFGKLLSGFGLGTVKSDMMYRTGLRLKPSN
ncbi:MAG TPA: BRO family protein [Allosphingosinicella sp.]